MASAITAVVFDAYGTPPDDQSAIQRHASGLGPDWQAISQSGCSEQSSIPGPAGQPEDYGVTRLVPVLSGLDKLPDALA